MADCQNDYRGRQQNANSASAVVAGVDDDSGAASRATPRPDRAAVAPDVGGRLAGATAYWAVNWSAAD